MQVEMLKLPTQKLATAKMAILILFSSFRPREKKMKLNLPVLPYITSNALLKSLSYI